MIKFLTVIMADYGLVSIVESVVWMEYVSVRKGIVVITVLLVSIKVLLYLN
jgi:hypothetical protein